MNVCGEKLSGDVDAVDDFKTDMDNFLQGYIKDHIYRDVYKRQVLELDDLAVKKFFQ